MLLGEKGTRRGGQKRGGREQQIPYEQTNRCEPTRFKGKKDNLENNKKNGAMALLGSWGERKERGSGGEKKGDWLS